MRKVQAFVMIVIGGMFTTATGLLVRHALTLQSPAAILGIAVAACVMAALAFVFLVGSFAVGRMAPAAMKPRPTPGSKTPTPGADYMPAPPGFVPPPPADPQHETRQKMWNLLTPEEQRKVLLDFHFSNNSVPLDPPAEGVK